MSTKKTVRKNGGSKKVVPISAAVTKGEADDTVVGKNLLLQSLARLGVGNRGIEKMIGYSNSRISYRIKKYGLVGCRAQYRNAEGDAAENVLAMCATIAPESKEERKLAVDVANQVYGKMFGGSVFGGKAKK